MLTIERFFHILHSDSMLRMPYDLSELCANMLALLAKELLAVVALATRLVVMLELPLLHQSCAFINSLISTNK